jgi:pSer/pThr/pTyr-binding forkhead associated (FHA) protein
VPSYRLQHLDHEVELPLGEFVIGRGSRCQLTIDDPHVSRRHVVLHVGTDQVTLEDLGSRNATLVNGAVVRGRVNLLGGDTIQLGRHVITIVRARAEDSRDDVPTGQIAVPWFHASRRGSAIPAPPPEVDESTEPSSMLVELAGKALEAGNLDECEWVLGKLLAEFHYRASGGDPPTARVLDAVVGHTLQFTRRTGKQGVLDGLFEVLGVAGHVIAPSAAAELEVLVAHLPSLRQGRLGRYAEVLRSRGADARVIARLDAIATIGPQK